jgi:hypothetical protein
MPSCLGPFFPPPSPLRAPRGKPRRCPFVPPSKCCFHRLNFGRSAAAVHQLGAPPTEPFPHQSQLHLTSLSPSPWCRARAPSSATTMPAPPPPTRCRLGEPHRRSSCPAHPPHRLRDLTIDPAACELLMSRCRPRHRAISSCGDRVLLRPRAHHAHAHWVVEPVGPSRCWAVQ